MVVEHMYCMLAAHVQEAAANQRPRRGCCWAGASGRHRAEMEGLAEQGQKQKSCRLLKHLIRCPQLTCTTLCIK